MTLFLIATWMTPGGVSVAGCPVASSGTWPVALWPGASVPGSTSPSLPGVSGTSPKVFLLNWSAKPLSGTPPLFSTVYDWHSRPWPSLTKSVRSCIPSPFSAGSTW